MDTFTSTDASAGFAESVLYQNPPSGAADYFARVSAYCSALRPGLQPDTTPTAENLRDAKALLLDNFLDTFNFCDQTYRAHALAMTLEPLVRPLISGPTPLYVVSGPPASGKTTLVEGAISPYKPGIVFDLHGHSAGRNWRRDIATGLPLRPTHFWIEGDESRLISPTLAAALTTTALTARISGRAETVILPVRCLWVYTSTKPVVSKDIAARAVNIRLIQNPTWRVGHLTALHGGLCADMIQPRLFVAAFTLVRAWLEAGRPMFTERHHRLSGWSRVMGGILEVANVPGFLDN